MSSTSPRRHRRVGGGGRWLLAGLAAAAAACSGGPRPAAAPPPPTVSAADAAVPEATPPEPEAPATPERPALRPPPPRVVIEPAEPEPGGSATLAEAAQRERRRRRQSGEPIAVITDDNLEDHAVGQLTFMEETPPDPVAESALAAAGLAADAEQEKLWRDRVRGLRQRWADAAARMPTIEERVADLRRRFYEADDGYYRDTRIKPAWDRAIDLVAQTRAEAEAHRLELQAALDEGRRAGALPGWLREGIELEPAPPEPVDNIHEPGEPQIVEPREGGGGE